MARINLEIIDYIQNADLDEKLQSFFISAIIYEMRNPDKIRFNDSYNSMIESAIKGD